MFFTCPTLPAACLAPGIQPLHFPCTLVQGWGPPSCSAGSSYCRTCPGWGMELLLGRAVLCGSQHSIISLGGWHGCDWDGCPAMPGRDWLGWGWWCQCPGEAGASLTDPVPVSCSSEPICAHLVHGTPLTASTSCSPSPALEPATQGLTAPPEPSLLTVWPLCLCISRPMSRAVQACGRLAVLLSGAAAAASPALSHMSRLGTARGAVCARKRGTLMQFVAI